MSQWQHSLNPSQAELTSFATSQSSSIVSYANAIYYPNWRVYRGHTPKTLNLGFISHVFYAFAWPNESGTVSLSDDYADNEIEVDGAHGCMNALVALKQQYPHLKLILSIGGGGQGSAHFARVASNEFTRHVFATSAKGLIDIHGFDGVDIDWEHPNSEAEGLDYLALLTHLRQLLPSPNYVLTTALPAGAWVLRNIPLAQCSYVLDFINLMAYDFSGPWNPHAGHHAQLFAPLQAQGDSCGASGVITALEAGVNPRKILLGIPAYGRSFLGTTGPGQPYFGQAGDDGTFEYKDLPRPGSAEGVDRQLAAAWCVGGDGGWVSYDNHVTVRLKATYARQNRLGGLFYWTGTGDAQGPRSLVEAGYNELHEQ